MSVTRVKTSLVKYNSKGEKYMVYPTSYADIIFLVKDDASETKVSIQEKFKEVETLIEGNKELVNKLEKKMKDNNPFKGTYNSLLDLKHSIDYDDLKPGDYAIVAHIDEDDQLYIFDANDRDWIEKGKVNRGDVQMVNGVLPNELGNVVIQIDNIQDLRDLLNNAATKKELSDVNKKAMKFCNEWNDGTNYRYNDVVSYENCLYVWVGEEISLNVLPNSNKNWKLIAVSEIYVEENGGKIDKIKINGVEQTIVNKVVDVQIDYATPEDLEILERKIPNATSKLTNDSDFATNASVDEKLSNISAPNVSGQINTHNEDIAAHPFILSLLPTVTKVEG